MQLPSGEPKLAKRTDVIAEPAGHWSVRRWPPLAVAHATAVTLAPPPPPPRIEASATVMDVSAAATEGGSAWKELLVSVDGEGGEPQLSCTVSLLYTPAPCSLLAPFGYRRLLMSERELARTRHSLRLRQRSPTASSVSPAWEGSRKPHSGEPRVRKAAVPCNRLLGDGGGPY